MTTTPTPAPTAEPSDGTLEAAQQLQRAGNDAVFGVRHLSLDVITEIIQRLAVSPEAARADKAEGEVRRLQAEAQLTREALQRVRDWLKFTANSDGGEVAFIDDAFRRCDDLRPRAVLADSGGKENT